MLSQGVMTASYIGASILFILALGGLSSQESSKRGNYFGMAGMALALVATVLGVVTANWFILIVAMGGGAAVGLMLAKKVQMTQMPELVAILHSMVGLAAVLVGYATFLDHETVYVGAEKTIHDIEIYLGVLIGACLLYTSPSPRDATLSRMPSSA